MKSPIRPFVPLVCFTLLAGSRVFAQTPGSFDSPEVSLLPVPEDEKQIQFRKMYASDGLPENTPLSIIQDSAGYMWIGTLNGLARYDGYSYKTFKHDAEDPTSLAAPAVGTVFEDSRGTIWAASGGQVNRLNALTESFERIEPDSLVDGFVWDIHEDAGGALWILNTDLDRQVGSLTRLDPASGEKTVFRHVADDSATLPEGPPLGIAEDDDGFLWVTIWKKGLSRFDPATGEVKQFRHDPSDPRSLPTNRVGALMHDAGRLWIGLGGGPDDDRVAAAIARFDIASETATPFAIEPPPVTNISSILKDHNGALWISTLEEGLYLFDETAGSFSAFRHNPLDPNSLSGNGIWDIHEDRSGVLWIGTWNHGVNQLDLASSRFYRLQHNPQDPNTIGPSRVEGLLEDRDGILWFAHDGGGMTRYDRLAGQIARYRHDPNDPNSIQSDRIRTIYQDSKGQYWVTGLEGLSRFDPASGRFYRYQHDPDDPTSLSNNGVQTILEDHRGDYWVATYGGGLNHFDPATGRFTHYRHAADDSTSLTHDQVMVLFEDSRHRLWVGSNGMDGLNLMDRETGTFRNRFSGFRSSVSSVAEDSQGNLWVGSFTGVYRIDPTSLTAEGFNERDGLDSETVNAIVEDDEGYIWVSTDRGLSRFDPKTETFRNFTKDDFGHTTLFENRAGIKSTLGPLFFGGAHGVTFFYPDQLLSNPYPPDVLLTDLRVFSKSVLEGDDLDLRSSFVQLRPITLAHDQNHIGIDFAAAHFSRPERNLYTFILEGYDQDWSDPSHQRSVTYTNLAPGDYVFRVRAANADGVWSEEPVSFAITIRPPWWRTLWAYGFYALLFGASLFGVDRFQRRRVILAERERARIQQAELRAEAAEAQSRALEAENERKKNVELLSDIGRRITGSLASEEIIDTVYASVNDLMDAAVFGIGIVDENRDVLVFPATREKGERLPSFVNRLSDDNRLAVRCFKRREEIIIGDYATEYSNYISRAQPPVAGDDASSIIYLPLVYKDRTIGVITAQSFTTNAYTEYHLNLLRNLATYASNALDNADAYRRLEDTLQHLRSTQEQLVTQEKLASLGALTAGIAHEIKNPLNFVNNFAELNREIAIELREVLASGDQDISDLIADLENNADQIAKHGRRADAIVRNMMLHAQGQTGLRQPVALNELLDEYIDLAFHGRRAQDPGFEVNIRREFDPQLGDISAAPQDLGRVVLNLVGNAFDALEEHAEATADNSFRPEVLVSTTRENGNVVICVADNGPGIPEQVRARIFEPFYTTKPTGAGTGLGLSLSYDIITKGHGGTLRTAESPLGGAAFVIELPVEDG